MTRTTKIEKNTKVPIEAQRLVYLGRLLGAAATLSSVGIKNGAVIQMQVVQRFKPSTNEFDAHYQFQSIWAGEKNLAKKVDKHYDIASKMDFGLMLSLSLPVEFIDYRKLDLNITIFNCVKGSLLAFPTLPESIPSLSCLHVIEYKGLGR